MDDIVNFLDRASRNLNMDDFRSRSHPIRMHRSKLKPEGVDRQYILRMMVRKPGSGFQIPEELHWLRPNIIALDGYQKHYGLTNEYVYVTVRHGVVESETDDQWHVDGFSMKFPHVSEQNYIWCSDYGTEFLINDWEIPKTFDPLKHNIHQYFQDHGSDDWNDIADEHIIYLMDPYCVHRRPKLYPGTRRTFWRISFVPIEIEDDTCTQNPLLPSGPYNRTDIRKTLTVWSE